MLSLLLLRAAKVLPCVPSCVTAPSLWSCLVTLSPPEFTLCPAPRRPSRRARQPLLNPSAQAWPRPAADLGRKRRLEPWTCRRPRPGPHCLTALASCHPPRALGNSGPQPPFQPILSLCVLRTLKQVVSQAQPSSSRPAETALQPAAARGRFVGEPRPGPSTVPRPGPAPTLPRSLVGRRGPTSQRLLL